jgi:hypothetical protein
MYTESFIEQVRRQRNAMIRRAAAIIVVFLTAAILVGVFAESALGLIVFCLGIAALLAFWGVRGAQVSAYYRYVMDVFMGRHRELETDVLSVSPEAVYKDNKLYYYEIETRQGDVERMLLWDANLPLPDIKAGQRVVFSVMDRYIWEIVH